MHRDVEKVLLSQQEIKDRVAVLGAKISADYEGKKLMLIGVLKGSVVFMADLMREISVSAAVDFMSVSSYGSESKSSGVVKIIKDIQNDITGMDVLIVEDILDSGNTLSYLAKHISAKGANSVRIVTLLDKPERRKVQIYPDYVGFIVPDEFIIGYGLDYDEKYRNLPYIGILKREVYEK